jgi:hypothetical protein
LGISLLRESDTAWLAFQRPHSDATRPSLVRSNGNDSWRRAKSDRELKLLGEKAFHERA